MKISNKFNQFLFKAHRSDFPSRFLSSGTKSIFEQIWYKAHASISKRDEIVKRMRLKSISHKFNIYLLLLFYLCLPDCHYNYHRGHRFYFEILFWNFFIYLFKVSVRKFSMKFRMIRNILTWNGPYRCAKRVGKFWRKFNSNS